MLFAEKKIVRYKVQKRVAISCSIVLLSIVVINIIVGLAVRKFSFGRTLLDPSVIVLFVLSLACAVTSLKDWRVFRVFHVVVFLGYPLLHILLSNVSPYDTSSLLWSIYGIILGIQYRLFQKRFWYFSLGYFGCFFLAKIFSTAKHAYFAAHAAPGVVLLLALFVYLFWIVFAEEIKEYSYANTRLSSERDRNLIFVKFGRTISGVIHNLKSVMMSIEGYNDLLRITDRENWDSIVDLQKRSSDRMLSMINNFMTAVRSYQRTDRLLIHLNRLVGSAVEVLQGNEILKHRLRIAMELQEPDTINAVPMEIMQIIDNLVTNAAEAMVDTGRFDLTIRTGSVDHWVFFQVKDEGVGMEFCVACKHGNCMTCKHFVIGRSSKEDGTGIGIIYVREILSEMNGDIKYESVKDQGTTVTVYFPYVSENENLLDGEVSQAPTAETNVGG